MLVLVIVVKLVLFDYRLEKLNLSRTGLSDVRFDDAAPGKNQSHYTKRVLFEQLPTVRHSHARR